MITQGRNISTLFLILFFTAGIARAQVDLNVVKGSWLEYSSAPDFLYHSLTSRACTYLDNREDIISEIKTLADWQWRQKYVRETLAAITCPFPEKTPLNSRIVRTIDKGSFRVEHIIYESLPGFRVTSSLYIPGDLKRNNKAPAVIYCSGHNADGYRTAVYQHVILNLVSKGFIVFAFDPVGQGERLEYYDPATGKSKVGGPTKEHSYPGSQAFLTGSSQAFYMTWDGIRAVDYLLGRKEVDPARIGITGRSGGGTQAAYIAAMDDRIYAAAPENYITSYRRLLQSRGPQDAEQNLFKILAHGLDHPDFLIVRAPKPALMITTSNDMFSIQGAMETEKEVNLVYKAYSKPGNFSRVEDDAGHASTLKNREAMYEFFRKHLNNPGDSHDQDIPQLTKEELQVTEKGQISLSPGSETVFSLNAKLAMKLNDELTVQRRSPGAFIPEVIISAKELSGYTEPEDDVEPVFTGRIVNDTYSVEKFFIKGESDYIIPFLLFKPGKSNGKAMIYLHPLGKAADAAPGGEIEQMVSMGMTVLAPDMLNTGELAGGALKGDAWFEGASLNLWYAAMITSHTITGMQAADVVRLAGWLEDRGIFKEIIGFAKQEMSPVMLHAAAFSPEIGSVVLSEPYLSYLSITLSRDYYPGFILSAVPGALKKYDLPDLAASIAPRKLFIEGAVDGSAGMSDVDGISRDLSVIRSGYAFRNAENNLQIVEGKPGKDISGSLGQWLK